MLKSYLPALVFLALGLGVGVAFTFLNSLLGPSRPSRVKREPYESGLPSDVRKSFRFGVSFYLVAMLFVIFDVEIVFLFAWAAQWDRLGWYGIAAVGIFTLFVLETLVYVWKRGALDWNVKLRRRYIRDVTEEAA